MTLVIPIDALVEPITHEQALEETLAIATSVGLPVTSYAPGDTTLSILETIAQWLPTEREVSAAAIAGGWLRYAAALEDARYLTVLALEVYNVQRVEQTFATTTIEIVNTSTDTHVIAANDLTFAHESTEKTYRNVTPTSGTITLSPGASTTLDFVADEGGSESSAGIGEINVSVSGFLGIVGENVTAAVGFDEETNEQLMQRCLLKAPAISRTGAGPEGKYAYVAVTPSENGGAQVTRCAVRGDNTDGSVEVVLAGPAGAVTSGDVELVEAALVELVVGPCETLSVVSATNVSINVFYSIWVYDDVNETAEQIAERVAQKLALLFALAPIGGWKKSSDSEGKVWVNLLEATIKSVTTRAFQVSVSGSDTTLTANQVPVLGAIDPNIVLEPTPATGGTI